jgi:hypothetical protein
VTAWLRKAQYRDLWRKIKEVKTHKGLSAGGEAEEEEGTELLHVI